VPTVKGNYFQQKNLNANIYLFLGNWFGQKTDDDRHYKTDPEQKYGVVQEMPLGNDVRTGISFAARRRWEYETRDHSRETEN
jgi:hypothetical protein